MLNVNLNIPIYRAKKIDSDEYIQGCLLEFDSEYFIVKDKGGCYLASDCFHYLDYDEIDPTTLAIHFPNMIDGQKNKIFASLSEDGKGGDVVTHPDYEDNKYILIYDKDRFEVGIKLIEIDEKGCWEYSSLQEEELELFEVIGIQK